MYVPCGTNGISQTHVCGRDGDLQRVGGAGAGAGLRDDERWAGSAGALQVKGAAAVGKRPLVRRVEACEECHTWTVFLFWRTRAHRRRDDCRLHDEAARWKGSGRRALDVDHGHRCVDLGKRKAGLANGADPGRHRDHQGVLTSLLYVVETANTLKHLDGMHVHTGSAAMVAPSRTTHDLPEAAASGAVGLPTLAQDQEMATGGPPLGVPNSEGM